MARRIDDANAPLWPVTTISVRLIDCLSYLSIYGVIDDEVKMSALRTLGRLEKERKRV